MPITVQLAAKLRVAARGRADHAPLLLQADGSPWGDNPGAGYHRDVNKIVTAIGARSPTRRCTRSGIPASRACCC